MASEQHDPAILGEAAALKVLYGLDHVRKRPSMYIGDVGQQGLHWMLFQLAADSLAETAAGYGRSLGVTLKLNGSVEVQDNGRGIDPAPHPVFGKPFLEAVLTQIIWPRISPTGRDWNDYAIANALSEWLLMETRYEGHVYRQEYRRGEPVGAVQQAGACSVSGTKVAFKPDPAIFTDTRFSYAGIRDRLREYAFLHSGVRAAASDEATRDKEEFEFKDGVQAFVQWLNRDRHPLHAEIPVVRGEQEAVRYEVGWQWCRERDETMRSFVNDNETTLGGTHVTGFRNAVTRSLNSFIREQGPQEGRVLEGDQARGGLTAVVSVQLAQPEFAGATKARLASEEARRAVGSGVGRFLRQFFESNPSVGQAVVRAVKKSGEEN
jgi:DNA gyrase subunit B